MDKFPSFFMTIDSGKDKPKNVTVSLKLALSAQAKGHSVGILLILDGVHLAEKGYIDNINVGDPFKPAKEKLTAFMKNGGQLFIAKACLKLYGISEENLMDDGKIIKAADIVDLLDNAKTSFKL